MFDFLLGLLMLAGLGVFAWGIRDMLRLMATHMRGNPEAVKAVVEHVFVPLFAEEKETERSSPPRPSVTVRPGLEEKSSDRN